MAMSSRVKWSIAILAIMALSFPIFLFMRGHSYNVERDMEVDNDTKEYVFTEVLTILVPSNDIIYMDMTPNSTLQYQILDTEYNVSKAFDYKLVASGEVQSNQTVHLEFSVAAIHQIQIKCFSDDGFIGMKLDYFQQTEVKGFYIWLIFLGVSLVVIWVGSFIIKAPQDEIPVANQTD